MLLLRVKVPTFHFHVTQEVKVENDIHLFHFHLTVL